MNNHVFCCENLTCFMPDPKALSGFPFFWLEKRRKNVLSCLILSLLVKFGLKNHKYDLGPINFTHKAYTPLENTPFLVYCFSSIAGKSLKSHQKHQPLPASYTSPKPSSITPLREKEPTLQKEKDGSSSTA